MLKFLFNAMLLLLANSLVIGCQSSEDSSDLSQSQNTLPEEVFECTAQGNGYQYTFDTVDVTEAKGSSSYFGRIFVKDANNKTFGPFNYFHDYQVTGKVISAESTDDSDLYENVAWYYSNDNRNVMVAFANDAISTGRPFYVYHKPDGKLDTNTQPITGVCESKLAQKGLVTFNCESVDASTGFYYTFSEVKFDQSGNEIRGGWVEVMNSKMLKNGETSMKKIAGPFNVFERKSEGRYSTTSANIDVSIRNFSNSGSFSEILWHRVDGGNEKEITMSCIVN